MSVQHGTGVRGKTRVDLNFPYLNQIVKSIPSNLKVLFRLEATEITNSINIGRNEILESKL